LTKSVLYVPVLFMSAAVQPSSATTDPDPPRADAHTPSRLGRVLSVVRKLIDYGKQLAGTVQQRAAAPGFALFAKPFGTADLAAVLARITSGLRRAAALEAALCCRAARGRDLTPSSIRMPDIRGPRPARLVAPPDAPPEPEPANHTEAPRLTRLPTEDEIAAEVRRRPVGAVIVDICRDLGIAPGQLDRPSGTNSATPSSPMAATSPASSATCTRGSSPSTPTTTPTERTPYGPPHRHDCRRTPPVRPDRRTITCATLGNRLPGSPLRPEASSNAKNANGRK
jgi:hypothetical protein